MTVYPFKATIRATGVSCVVTIPKAYLDNGLLKEGEEYDFYAEVEE